MLGAGAGALLVFSIGVVVAAFALRPSAARSQTPTPAPNSAVIGTKVPAPTSITSTTAPALTATLPPSTVAAVAPSPTPIPTATRAVRTPTPVPSPTLDEFAVAPQTVEQVQSLLSRLPGLSSSFVVFPDGKTVEKSSDRQTPSASVIKMWIAGAAYDAAATGHLDLNQSYMIQASDQQTGTGILNQKSYVGQAIKYSDLIDIMLLYSDNTAADIIVRQIGGMNTVDAYARNNGYTNTIMQRLLGQLDPNHDNYRLPETAPCS